MMTRESNKISAETINPNEILFSLPEYTDAPKIYDEVDSDATPDLSLEFLDLNFSNKVGNIVPAPTNNQNVDTDSDVTTDLSVCGSFRNNKVVTSVPVLINNQNIDIDSDATPDLSLNGSFNNEVVNIVAKDCSNNIASKQIITNSIKSSQSSLTFARKTLNKNIKRKETNRNCLKVYYNVVKNVNNTRYVNQKDSLLEESENEAPRQKLNRKASNTKFEEKSNNSGYSSPNNSKSTLSLTNTISRKNTAANFQKNRNHVHIDNVTANKSKPIRAREPENPKSDMISNWKTFFDLVMKTKIRNPKTNDNEKSDNCGKNQSKNQFSSNTSKTVKRTKNKNITKCPSAVWTEFFDQIINKNKNRLQQSLGENQNKSGADQEEKQNQVHKELTNKPHEIIKEQDRLIFKENISNTISDVSQNSECNFMGPFNKDSLCIGEKQFAKQKSFLLPSQNTSEDIKKDTSKIQKQTQSQTTETVTNFNEQDTPDTESFSKMNLSTSFFSHDECIGQASRSISKFKKCTLDIYSEDLSNQIHFQKQYVNQPSNLDRDKQQKSIEDLLKKLQESSLLPGQSTNLISSERTQAKEARNFSVAVKYRKQSSEATVISNVPILTSQTNRSNMKMSTMDSSQTGTNVDSAKSSLSCENTESLPLKQSPVLNNRFNNNISNYFDKHITQDDLSELQLSSPRLQRLPPSQKEFSNSLTHKARIVPTIGLSQNLQNSSQNDYSRDSNRKLSQEPSITPEARTEHSHKSKEVIRKKPTLNSQTKTPNLFSQSSQLENGTVISNTFRKKEDATFLKTPRKQVSDIFGDLPFRSPRSPEFLNTTSSNIAKNSSEKFTSVKHTKQNSQFPSKMQFSVSEDDPEAKYSTEQKSNVASMKSFSDESPDLFSQPFSHKLEFSEAYRTPVILRYKEKYSKNLSQRSYYNANSNQTSQASYSVPNLTYANSQRVHKRQTSENIPRKNLSKISPELFDQTSSFQIVPSLQKSNIWQVSENKLDIHRIQSIQSPDMLHSKDVSKNVFANDNNIKLMQDNAQLHLSQGLSKQIIGFHQTSHEKTPFQNFKLNTSQTIHDKPTRNLSHISSESSLKHSQSLAQTTKNTNKYKPSVARRLFSENRNELRFPGAFEIENTPSSQKDLHDEEKLLTKNLLRDLIPKTNTHVMSQSTQEYLSQTMNETKLCEQKSRFLRITSSEDDLKIGTTFSQTQKSLLSQKIFSGSQKAKRSNTAQKQTAENWLEDQLINKILKINYDRFHRLHTEENKLKTILKSINKSTKNDTDKGYVKRYRKGMGKIYKVKQIKKRNKIDKSHPNWAIEALLKSLDRDYIEQPSTESDTSSYVSTNSSYKTDATTSEILSTGSGVLSSSQKMLRKSFNEISKDKTLLHSGTTFSRHAKEHILMKIQQILLEIYEDLKNGRHTALKYRKQVMDNCVFEDGRLQLKPPGEAVMTEIKSSNQKSRTNFKLVLIILNRIHCLLETNTKITKRELFYQLKNMTNEQRISDKVINSISCMLNVGMWELNILAQKGLVFGDVKLLMTSGEMINCNVPGTLIPSDINEISEIQSSAYFILVVEKESIYHKLIEEDLPNTMTRPFILITGKGFPDLNTQLFLKKLWIVISIPVFILVDADPHGINIMLNYRFGSVSHAHVSHHLTVPNAKWLGILPSDIYRYQMKTEPLTQRDVKMLEQFLRTPYIEHNPLIGEQINVLLEHGYKASIEGLIKFDKFISQSYLTSKFYLQQYI